MLVARSSFLKMTSGQEGLLQKSLRNPQWKSVTWNLVRVLSKLAEEEEHGVPAILCEAQRLVPILLDAWDQYQKDEVGLDSLEEV